MLSRTIKKFITYTVISILVLVLVLVIVQSINGSFFEKYMFGKDSSFAKQILPYTAKVFTKFKVYDAGSTPRIFDTGAVNVLIDGEAWEIESADKYDLIVTTKKSKNKNSIFVPFFSQAFAELKTVLPENLLRLDRRTISKSKFCGFLASNCTQTFEGVRYRETLFDEIGKNVAPVDALGKCKSKNVSGIPGKTSEFYMDDAIDLYRPYKFVLCVENVFQEGYITEKIVLPLLAGCVPIYMGAPDIKEYFSDGYINARDFDSSKELLHYIRFLDENSHEYDKIRSKACMQQQSYEKYFSWFLGTPPFYDQLYTILPQAKRFPYSYSYTRNTNQRTNIKVINMARSVERWISVQERLDRLNINFDRFEAVDGKEVFLGFNHSLVSWKTNWGEFLRTKMLPGELGVFLSNMEVYKALVHDTENDYYVVLEDDVRPSPRFSNIHSILKEAPRGWDMIFLGINKNGCSSADLRYPTDSKTSFIRMEFPYCMPGAFAFVIHKRAAMYFLRFAFPLEFPIDNIFQANSDNLRIYITDPPICDTNYDRRVSTIKYSDLENL